MCVCAGWVITSAIVDVMYSPLGAGMGQWMGNLWSDQPRGTTQLLGPSLQHHCGTLFGLVVHSLQAAGMRQLGAIVVKHLLCTSVKLCQLGLRSNDEGMGNKEGRKGGRERWREGRREGRSRVKVCMFIRLG